MPLAAVALEVSPPNVQGAQLGDEGKGKLSALPEGCHYGRHLALCKLAHPLLHPPLLGREQVLQAQGVVRGRREASHVLRKPKLRGGAHRQGGIGRQGWRIRFCSMSALGDSAPTVDTSNNNPVPRRVHPPSSCCEPNKCLEMTATRRCGVPSILIRTCDEIERYRPSCKRAARVKRSALKGCVTG